MLSKMCREKGKSIFCFLASSVNKNVSYFRPSSGRCSVTHTNLLLLMSDS